ncbi:hypothetical protein CCACVL1_14280 [Corchorus capsularis]|uniref:Uncharacterized protein n=1 Tax=Corchorus capsularis TaxID=210143 RepID=A0A1R3I7L6_COCAP|nr:hypothetical protein CCACVL1_14280 [Corchorus capsularis]
MKRGRSRYKELQRISSSYQVGVRYTWQNQGAEWRVNV